MKPEVWYSDIVIESYIEDLIDEIKWNMKLVSPIDPYFEQLSVEKFTLETLLQEIAKHRDMAPTEIVERFVKEIDWCVSKSLNPSSNYTFSVSRDAAMSILGELYFGYLESV